ncbi:MAG: hypothetical protein AB7V18_15195 [Pyrinomonadaceae bacterium]
MSEEKRGYFEWRESWIGYEDFDSNLDEDEVRRRTLLITAADEKMWRKLKDASFIVEF